MNSASIAHALTLATDITISADHVVTVGTHGYTIEGIPTRGEAIRVAQAVMAAFDADLEAGLPTIAVRSAFSPLLKAGTFYVRVSVD